MATTHAAPDPADRSSVDDSTTAAIIPSSPVQPSAALGPANSPKHVTSTRAVPLTRTDTSVVLMPDASAAYAPSATQTSSFLYGSVAVKVLFVESTGGDENWTETEVNKVKSEVALLRRGQPRLDVERP
jgi:hypothetical protein